jgi:hypothetical protein
MEPILIGYFPKRVEKQPEWLRAAGVSEICSASGCISRDPTGWVKHWLHNALWVFDDEATARAVVPAAEVSNFELFAFRMFPVQFNHGKEEPFAIPPMQVQPLPLSYARLGYDAVSRTYENAFECSPLSCNYAAQQIPVNRFCLLDDAERALRLARRFSDPEQGYEPGPYFVVEVLRETSTGHDHQPSTSF